MLSVQDHQRSHFTNVSSIIGSVCARVAFTYVRHLWKAICKPIATCQIPIWLSEQQDQAHLEENAAIEANMSLVLQAYLGNHIAIVNVFTLSTVGPRYLELAYFELPLISKWKSGPCFETMTTGSKMWKRGEIAPPLFYIILYIFF